MDIKAEMQKIGAQAKFASAELACASSEQKKQALDNAANEVWAFRAGILKENTFDMNFALEKGLSAAMLDRLMLDEVRIKSIEKLLSKFGILQIARTGKIALIRDSGFDS